MDGINAPYLITDIFHLTKRPPVPYWFDLVLVMLAAWNGLLLGILSLMQVERFLKQFFTRKWLGCIIAALLLLCGYGIYLGRFLRFNSWDVLSNPGPLLKTSLNHVLQPHDHFGLWSFSLLFATMFGITYYTLKSFGQSSVS